MAATREAAAPELRQRVLGRIDDDEVVRLAQDLFLCTRVLALTALEAAL